MACGSAYVCLLSLPRFFQHRGALTLPIQIIRELQPFIAFIARSASARLAYALLSIILMSLLGFSLTMVQELIDYCTIQYCSAANVGEIGIARTTPIGISFVMVGSPLRAGTNSWPMI
jgi:hypothetical protein